MGEVYRARDGTLNRDVALKVRSEAFAPDSDRLARFKREAHVLASLNHPNIAAIYGLEESTGVPALVLELVEGPTLANRIAHGAIPIDEALAIATQVAEGLKAAHETGIIHRDLKPSNIKLRADGTVKILDFGLAKAFDPSGSGAAVSAAATLTSPAMTRAGMIFGTAAYMSPEQARGKTVDNRSDIWAFGCVVYEMLTGRQAFSGETIQDTLTAVLTHEPDWSMLPADTPAGVVRLLRRCLAKDPARRLHSVADARIEIEDADAAKPIAVFARASTRGALAAGCGGRDRDRHRSLEFAASAKPNSRCDSDGEAIADRAAQRHSRLRARRRCLWETDKRHLRSLLTEHVVAYVMEGQDGRQLYPTRTGPAGARADPADGRRVRPLLFA